MATKKLIVFDLDDTLTRSKQPMGDRMGSQIYNLIQEYQVAIISGCHFKQMTSQVLPFLDPYAYLKNLYLLPTSGAQLYCYQDDDWIQKYEHNLTLREKVKIYNAWVDSIDPEDIGAAPTHGDIEEDRGSQVTFSMCGQEAPIDVKKEYDPDCSIRNWIAERMRTFLGSDYSIRVGGSTSIDVSKVGLDKAYGVRELQKHLGLIGEEILFIGDKLQPGGNDYSVKEAGYDCIEVADPQETYNIIKDLNHDKT